MKKAFLGMNSGAVAPGGRAKRIRFVHQFFYPEISSVSQIITQLARQLAGCGHHVSVIASKDRYTGNSAASLPSREYLDGIEIRRTWVPALGKGSILRRVLSKLFFVAGATWASLTAPRADTVVLLTDPPLFAALGLLLKRVRRERFVYVVMDLYPDIAVQSGVLRAGSPLTRLLRALTRCTLRGADQIVVLGECMRERVLAYGADPRHVTIIHNWADEDAIRPVCPDQNSFRRSRGWGNKLVVMYSGNLGMAHRFDDLLEVARRRRDDPSLVFAFIGGGARRNEVEAFRQQHGLDNVDLLPYQDTEALSLSLGAGDLHFISLRAGFEGLVVPSKAYGIMAAGRPILYQGARSSEIARMIDGNGIGAVVAEGDVDGLEAAVVDFQADRARLESAGQRAREVLLRYYAREDAFREYCAALSCAPRAGV